MGSKLPINSVLTRARLHLPGAFHLLFSITPSLLVADIDFVELEPEGE
jgi:hypothetical protein